MALSGMSVLDGVGLAIEQAHTTCVVAGRTDEAVPARSFFVYLPRKLADFDDIKYQ